MTPEGDPAAPESTADGLPATADDGQQRTEGEAGILRFTLAEGSELPPGVLTKGWIEPGWVRGQLGRKRTSPAAEVAVQRQGDTRSGRILLALADALNRQLGPAPGPADLHRAESALTILRDLTLAYRDYHHPRKGVNE